MDVFLTSLPSWCLSWDQRLPVRGGCVEALRSFLNAKTDDDFVFAVSWLLAAMRDRGPYPVLAPHEGPRERFRRWAQPRICSKNSADHPRFGSSAVDHSARPSLSLSVTVMTCIAPLIAT
jgi:hypothetical protein